MKCPVDGTLLSMTEIKSLIVDYCPQCRGVWLPRDSLNKLIERAERQTKPPESPAAPATTEKTGEEKPKTIVDDILEGFGLK